MASLKPAFKVISKLFTPHLTIDDNTMLQIARRIDEKKRQENKKSCSTSSINTLVKTPDAAR